jgi:gamma-glutamylcyclotransferase (GGCT)/AIG2-like uncharacterized protein YtfP
VADWWFTYPPFDQHDFLARVLGRTPELIPAELSDYQWVEHPAYTYVVPVDGMKVQGSVLAMQLGDDWLLDDEFGIRYSYYRRVEVSVKTASTNLKAWVMIGGPSLSWAIQGQEDTESA